MTLDGGPVLLTDELGSRPSSIAEMALWFAYLAVICVILYLAVRDKQLWG